MNTPHPSRDDFVAWLTGGLDSDQIHAIETHVDHCPTCLTELESIEQSCNSMQRQVRSACQATINEDQPPEVKLPGLMLTIDSEIAVDDSGINEFRNDEQAAVRTVSRASAESDTSVSWDQPVRQSAHDIGVIHRDLKPANIMMDLHGEPVVMDFGLARRSASDDVQVTQSGAIMGTPAYMAPELIAGDQSAINHRCDIYALGVVMYELIAGELDKTDALTMEVWMRRDPRNLQPHSMILTFDSDF